jgi:hypothetical protein
LGTAWRGDDVRLRSLVGFLHETTVCAVSPFVIPWEEGDDSLTANLAVVRLWERPQERVLSSPTYELWPLSGLMAGATAATIVATAERLARLPAPKQERDDLIGRLVGLAGIC